MSEPVSLAGDPGAAPAVPPTCPNCAAPVPGRFCGECGQEQRSLRVPFHHLAGEALAETFTLDSRLARTIPPLLFRPGAVTQAYLAGRRARFTSPVKLYLLVSFLFFLVAAIRPERGPEVAVSKDRDTSAIVNVSEDDLASLRSGGAAGAWLADRLEALSKEPADVVRRRLAAGLVEHLPRALFLLLPVFALLLRVFYLRSRFYLAEHLVFALHAHAVAYLLLLPGALTDRGSLTTAGLVLAGAHTVGAMRRVYERPWRGTVARAAGISVLYGLLLLLALVGAVAWAMLEA